jgi:hypothetical protein
LLLLPLLSLPSLPTTLVVVDVFVAAVAIALPPQLMCHRCCCCRRRRRRRCRVATVVVFITAVITVAVVVAAATTIAATTAAVITATAGNTAAAVFLIVVCAAIATVIAICPCHYQSQRCIRFRHNHDHSLFRRPQSIKPQRPPLTFPPCSRRLSFHCRHRFRFHCCHHHRFLCFRRYKITREPEQNTKEDTILKRGVVVSSAKKNHSHALVMDLY